VEASERLPDHVAGEPAALEASGCYLRIAPLLPAHHQAGARHLMVSGQLTQGLLAQRAGDPLGGKLLCDQGSSARPGPPRHKSPREGQVVEVAELAEAVQGLLYLLGRAPALQELATQLRGSVGPEGE
jgi:hypothetical protein